MHAIMTVYLKETITIVLRTVTKRRKNKKYSTFENWTLQKINLKYTGLGSTETCFEYDFRIVQAHFVCFRIRLNVQTICMYVIIVLNINSCYTMIRLRRKGLGRSLVLVNYKMPRQTRGIHAARARPVCPVSLSVVFLAGFTIHFTQPLL